MIRLAIAEDHQALIDGILLLMKYEDDISIVGTANNGEDLVKLVKLKRPNVIITDIRMPKMDGITATKIIKSELPETKIIAFSMFDQSEAIEQMLEAGVTGYVLKNSSLSELLDAVRTVHAGTSYFDANINVKQPDAKKKKGILTNRQIQILELVAQGKTSRQIAEELHIGVQTVDTHRKNMIRILGLHGKGELMRYALERKYRF